MKKIGILLLTLVLFLAGCGSSTTNEIDTLKVAFVPSAPAEEILAATEPLGDMLITEMGKQDFTVNNVEITVGTSYEAVGEGLAAGTIDVGLIPGGTFVLYEPDGVELALTATRDGLSIDSEDPNEWNKAPTEYDPANPATFYRSLIVAGPSEYGRELANKVLAGEELTFDELAEAKWCTQSSSSSAGYLYPSYWLNQNYGKMVADLPNTVEIKGYGESVARLSAEQCDIAPMYADARMDNQKSWASDENIFDATTVIGVTPSIYNDTISVSQNSEYYSADFLAAVQQSFISIASTEKGLETVKPYNHTGYVIGDPANYEDERVLQTQLKENL